ncbi:VTC domain-containing protein [Pilobolus umbonatus]|nr:VTC domain-containing protein [Pilobolus umbonatus]
MKFGEQLEEEIFPPWKLSYLAYNSLKEDLLRRQLDHKWNEEDESEFLNKLENELTKVYDFVTAKLGEVEARISHCERTIQTFIKNPSWSSEDMWMSMDDGLTEVLFDVNDLAKFSRLNYIGFQKIIKKHDKWTGLNLKQNFIPQLRSKPLDKQRFDVAIVFISALHDLCRQRGQSSTMISSISPHSASTSNDDTTKYWIHPDNITEVKSIIMLHLPLFIYNQSKKFEPSDCAVSNIYLDNAELGIYTNRLQRDEGAESIRLRWHGDMLTDMIRLECDTYQGDWNIANSIKEYIMIHQSDVNQFITGRLTSTELVNRLQSSENDGLSDQQLKLDECLRIATKIQSSIKENRLKPVCRVFYNRTVFKQPVDIKKGEEPICINIDNDVCFIREDDFDEKVRRGNNEWRRPDVGIDSPFPHLDDKEVHRFPYAVLEIKLPNNRKSDPPAWLANILESHLVHEVPRFSKYLHGVSYLFRKRLPLLPWWLSEMEVDIRKPRATNFGLSRSMSFKPLIDGQYRRAMQAENRRIEFVNDHLDNHAEDATTLNSDLEKQAAKQEDIDWENRPHRMQSTLVSKGDNPLNYGPLNEKKGKRRHKEEGEMGEEVVFSNGDIRLDMPSGKTPNDSNGNIPLKKVKVEPKVFFSNERTFISWLQFCALLLTVALNLLNFGDQVSRIAGAIFLVIAAGIAIYALYQFEKRAWMINHRIVGRYDDIWGPAVLCFLLVAALAVNFYLRFR